MDKQDIEILDQKTNYKGYFSIVTLQYRHKLFAGGWSDVVEKEVFERGNSVGVLLYDPIADRIAMIEQCRAGAVPHPENPWLVEIVAGECEPDETNQQVAIREAKEEAGVDITELVPICNYFVSPGGSTEKMELFCARVDSHQMGGIYGLQDEHEDIKVIVVACDEAFEQVRTGAINTGPAIIALQWLQLNKHNLWQE